MIVHSKHVLEAATTAIGLPQDQRTEFLGRLLKYDECQHREVAELVKSHQANLQLGLRGIRDEPAESDLMMEVEARKSETSKRSQSPASNSNRNLATIKHTRVQSPHLKRKRRGDRATVAVAALASMFLVTASIAGTLLLTNSGTDSELSNVVRDLSENVKRLEIAEAQILEMRLQESTRARQAALPPSTWR